MSELVAHLHKCVGTGLLDFSIFGDLTEVKNSAQECEVLDFKQQLPESDFEYAKTVRDLVALHNSFGGFLVFGVRETEKDRAFELVGVPPNGIQLGKLRDMARAYLGTDLRLSGNSQILNGKNIEVVWVAKRSMGDSPTKFTKNGPEEKPGKLCFKRGEVVFRRIESNAVAQLPEDYDFLYSARRPPSIELTAADFDDDDPVEHNLPDRAFVCSRFVGRRDDLGDLWTWLADDFSRVRLIAGEGGLGKTSLAYRFAEEVASRRVKPFEHIVWLTAKKRQFIPSEDSHRENHHTDFEDANSLLVAIASAHGCVDADFVGLDPREMLQLALESCAAMPSFIVVDDVDSLTPEDQQRTLELGMRTPTKTKMLLTTRVNFSYSPDNVLKLNGLPEKEFVEYVQVVRDRYGLPSIKDSKIEYLRDVSGGSPLFTDSLLRLERRGLSLDQAINQWKGERGMEARKAALQREVQQLSREAKRTLYVISHVRSASYVELSQILGYTEQTLGDALQELAGLFLVSAPSIGREARYTVEPNTGLLALELGQVLGIDHAALVAAVKRARTDAIGISLQKRSGIVGLAIAQAIALLKSGDPKAALEAVVSASKQLSKPNADLLLALGRFSLKLDPPNRDQASRAFSDAYLLGQRKQLLFDLWFDAEYGRGSLESALDVTAKAIDHQVGDTYRWFERSAQAHIALARRSGTKISLDSAIREVDLAISDLRKAKESCKGDLQYRHMDMLLAQAQDLRRRLSIGG